MKCKILWFSFISEFSARWPSTTSNFKHPRQFGIQVFKKWFMYKFNCTFKTLQLFHVPEWFHNSNCEWERDRSETVEGFRMSARLMITGFEQRRHRSCLLINQCDGFGSSSTQTSDRTFVTKCSNKKKTLDFSKQNWPEPAGKITRRRFVLFLWFS